MLVVVLNIEEVTDILRTESMFRFVHQDGKGDAWMLRSIIDLSC